MSRFFQTDPRNLHVSLADLCSTLNSPVALCSSPEYQLNGKSPMKTVEQLSDKLHPDYANKVISIVDFMGSTSGDWTGAKIRTCERPGKKVFHRDDFDIDLSSTEEFDNYFAAHHSEFQQRAQGNEQEMRQMATKSFAIRNSQWNSYWRGKVAGGLTTALSMMQPTETNAGKLKQIGLGFSGMDLSKLRFAIAAVIDGGPVAQEEQREMASIVDEVVYDLRRRGPSWAKNAAILLVRFPDVESFIKSLQGDKNLIRTSRFPTRQRDTFEFQRLFHTRIRMGDHSIGRLWTSKSSSSEFRRSFGCN